MLIKKNKIAIIGIQGLPAKYGGYETLVDYLSEYNDSNETDLLIYCSKKHYKVEINNYKSANLKYINLPSNGIFSFLYDSYCILDSVKNFDKILLLGCSGGLILPFLKKYKHKFILNIGGVEWKRSKYNYLLRLIVRFLMHISVRNSGKLIADNIGIKNYIKEEYNRTDAEIIEYGGDQVKINKNIESILINYPFLKDEYILALGRIQSDNNIEMLLEAFKDTKKKFVYIGNWDVSNYSKFLKNKYSKFNNLILLDAIYDLNILDIIRSNCKYYIHAHSAGGTNPSLVEAMHYKIPILCYDNGFNNYTTKNKSIYFKCKDQLKNLINNLDSNFFLRDKIANDLYLIAHEYYKWEIISLKYFKYITK